MYGVRENVHTNAGDNMRNSNCNVLSSLLKTAQQGQVEIRSLLDTVMEPRLRCALEQQLREYESIETEAQKIAHQRGWDLPEMDTAHRFLRDRMIRMKLGSGYTDSRIADLMIRMNTRGMISSMQQRNRMQEQDTMVKILSQKLLDCENAGIRTMQTFL